MLSESLEFITLTGLIPFAFAIIGGFLAYIIPMQRGVFSVLQHLVAGILLGAVAIELLPNILISQAKWTIGIGFLLGVFFILFVHFCSSKLENYAMGGTIPLAMMFAIIIDFFVDGMLISTAFLANTTSAFIIAFSLSFCSFLLCLHFVTSMRRRNVSMFMQIIALVLTAIALPIGALSGGFIIEELPMTISIEILAFGVAALLYLSCEELLKEAHEHKHRLIDTFFFFIGFLLILLFRM